MTTFPSPASMMTPFQQKCDFIVKALTSVLAFMIPISTTIAQIVLISILILWFFSGNLYLKTQRILHHPVARFSLILFLIFLLGVIYATAPMKDSLSMLWKMSKILYIPFLIPLFTHKIWRQRCIIAFISAVVLTLFLSLLKKYTGLPLPTHPAHGHYFIFKNHIDTTLMVSIATFLVAHHSFHHRDRWIQLTGACLITVMTFYVFWMGEGRTGYVIFIALWLTFSFQRLSLKIAALGMTILLLMGSMAWMGSHNFQDRVTRVSRNVQAYQQGDTDTPVGARIEYLKNSLELGKKNPLWGVGTGGLKKVYADLAHAKKLKFTTTNLHNEYMNIFVQWGGMGLTVFLILCGIIIKTSFSLPLPERHFAQGILIAIMIGSTANSWLMDFTPGYVFVVLIALVNGALICKENKWPLP
jgi:O-antigen ligase